MKTVNTYIATNTTIDAREEQGMVSEGTVKRKSRSTKKSSSADNTPVKVIFEIVGSKKRVATEDNAPAIPKKRRTVKTKPSPSQANLDIVNVAQDVVPIQVIDPTPVVATIKSPAPKRKSRKRRLVLPTGFDDETMDTQELAKDTDGAAVKPTDEVDIIIERVLEETLNLGVNEEEHGGQGVDETMFAEDFSQWLDDFVSRNSEPEIVGTRTITEVAGSTSPVVVKDMNRAVSSMFTNEELMSIDDLLLQISDDMLLPSITATEITKIRLGESVSITEVRERDIHLTSLPRISTHDKGKAISEEDEPIRGNPARELVELIVRYRVFDQDRGPVVQRGSGDIQEVDTKDVEEVDLVSSDGSTVYRSPSPSFQEVDSVEHDLQFALGPAIFPSVAQEERLYYVQSPESSPAISLPQESSSSSSDVSMYFDSVDIPLNAQADTRASAPVDFTALTDALEDLRSSMSKRIHDSNCEILSKINSVEIGIREALLKQNDLFRQSLLNARRDHETQGFTQVMHINDLKKGMRAQVGPVFQDLMDIKRNKREQDVKITALDSQVAAIRNEQLDFQSKIAADLLSLSTQFGDIVDYIRGGDAKKGEGSSSRPPHSFPGSSSRPLQPPPADQIRDSGHVASMEELEEAAERIREADRREADRRERERYRQRRERRLSRSGAFKRRRGF
ncbi:hypothetical protein F511_28314 [Dorcoceras hygrometricum]|uniref:Uncharacterized protein n=1 Tax=Dorcoceras hygrometricum TaxID=472368 RepID=A0A2Z7B491_9LAMI|nr:hypothetical protein F511_28314 [Dorcoceras hygrometricum]